VKQLHQNAQRLLRPLLVANPFGPSLGFMDSQIRTRRDHMKYLTLIRAVALLRQHQKTVKETVHQGSAVRFIEVEAEDIRLANELAHQVLGRSLDELPPHTRRLLVLLHEMVRAGAETQGVSRADFRFSRRDVREHTGLGDTQLKVHLGRLVELEHVLVHRGGPGGRHLYELVYDGAGQDGVPFVPGLIDAARLYDRKWSGSGADRSGSGRPPVGGRSGGGRGAPGEREPRDAASLDGASATEAENARTGTRPAAPSKRKTGAAPAPHAAGLNGGRRRSAAAAE